MALFLGTSAGVAQDWSGAYAGLSLGRTTFDQVASSGGVPGPRTDELATSLGIFAGYQKQSGQLVYGAELALSKASFAPDGTIHISDTDYAYVDLSARLGYAVGPVLLYGKAGISHADVTYTGPGVTIGTDGTLLGIGADYAISDQIALGLDYTVRNLETDIEFGGSPFNIDDKSESLSLRLGYRF